MRIDVKEITIGSNEYCFVIYLNIKGWYRIINKFKTLYKPRLCSTAELFEIRDIFPIPIFKILCEYFERGGSYIIIDRETNPETIYL